MTTRRAAMLLADETTWPPQLRAELHRMLDTLMGYELEEEAIFRAYTAAENQRPMALMGSNRFHQDREAAVQRLAELLQPHQLRGWHCSRLTAEEREHILRHGMQPPTSVILAGRITRLEGCGAISAAVAERLRNENCAGDEFREKRIWFCFFPPSVAGESGVGRLLRNWGGEALYGMHERDKLTGPILQTIGTPCLVEADLPIADLSQRHSLVQKLARRYCVNCGPHTGEPIDHQDRTTRPVIPDQIRRIILPGDPDFTALTGCDGWETPL